MTANPYGDKAEITEVLTRYATGIDNTDWALLRTCWADEIEVDYAPVGQYTDPDELNEVIRQLHEPMGQTYHRLSNFAIDVDGDRATARCYVHAVLQLSAPDNWIEVFGHYDDALVKTADGWRIQKRATHTARMVTPPPPAAS